MNALFLAICGISVVFFAVFLLECSRPRSKAIKSAVVRESNAAEVVDSGMEPQCLLHLEQQMVEFLSHHGRTTTVLLFVLLAMPLALHAQGAPSAPDETNAPKTESVAVNSALEPQPNQDTVTAPTQSNSTSSQDSKAAAVNDPGGSDAAAAASGSTLHGNFFQRLGQAYMQDWKGTAPSGPTPPYRGYPAPLTTPPYPFAVWPYGGSVPIGYPWTQSAPLMQAIWSGPGGDAWKRGGVQIYGWFNGGFDFSTSTHGHYANAPAAYYIVPNSIQPDQQALYIERQPDTVQTDHFDWGFRLAEIWGIDYRFTTSKGIFSQQLLGRVNSDGTFGKEYGYDPVMFYGDFYFPHVGQGMDLRIGRYISIPDIEAQLAPNNYTYSHSLLYSYDCYTQVGLMTTTKLSDHWLVQAGVSPGCDVAPWDSTDAKLTLTVGFQYSWNDGNDTIYPVLNALNDGKYAYNNLNAMYVTWYHKFRSHPSVHLSTEGWYMWEKQVPNVNNPAGASLIERNANGAVCQNSQQVTCYAPEWAIVNYIEKEFNKTNYISIRNEYFDDIRGQRTGFKTRYTENFLGWGHWIGSTVLFRPELRFEHAYDAKAYANGTKNSQFVFASDVIFFF